MYRSDSPLCKCHSHIRKRQFGYAIVTSTYESDQTITIAVTSHLFPHTQASKQAADPLPQSLTHVIPPYHAHACALARWTRHLDGFFCFCEMSPPLGCERRPPCRKLSRNRRDKMIFRSLKKVKTAPEPPQRALQ